MIDAKPCFGHRTVLGRIKSFGQVQVFSHDDKIMISKKPSLASASMGGRFTCGARLAKAQMQDALRTGAKI